MTQSLLIPTPKRPWEARPVDHLLTFFVLMLGALLTYVIVEMTPLKGKLAYFILYFILTPGLIFLRELRKTDLPGAKDTLLSSFSFLGIILTLIPIGSILYTVFSKGIKGLHSQILTKDMALASVNDPLEAGGLSHALVGTVILVGGALLLSFPIGLLTGLYLTEIRGRMTRPIRFLVQAMSGVPSIVAGLFILSAIIYPITQSLSGFMGSLALSILMIPTIARTAEEVLLLIPNELREAGVALGATQWRTVAMVVVPAAKSGIVTAIILGVARIVGETAPILLVTGGGDSLNLNPFSGAMGSLPFYIWKSFLTGGTEVAAARAWAGMMILLTFIFILFGLARYFGGRKGK